MKVFFSSPIRGMDLVEPYIRHIDKQLQKMGHKNLDNVIERLNDANYYDKLNKGGKEAHTAFFEKIMRDIKASDVAMFECTVPSLGIGFQVEKSLAYNKPTVVLYYRDNIPHFLSGTKNDKLLIFRYDENTLDSVLENALEEASHASDKRFNFFISPALLTYMEEESGKMGVTKSAFIRHLLLEHRKKRK